MSTIFDWTTFTKRIGINAPLQHVYEAWTTQAGLEKWFLRKAECTKADNTLRERNSNVQKGDRYEWMWFGHPDSTYERGTIVEANGINFLRFTFTLNSVVNITLKTEGSNTVVELMQEKIPPDENPKTNLLVGCGEGWTFYLANLKSILEGGIDLRNKDVALRNVINS